MRQSASPVSNRDGRLQRGRRTLYSGVRMVEAVVNDIVEVLEGAA
jgi:hypothetical protein